MSTSTVGLERFAFAGPRLLGGLREGPETRTNAGSLAPVCTRAERRSLSFSLYKGILGGGYCPPPIILAPAIVGNEDSSTNSLEYMNTQGV